MVLATLWLITFLGLGGQPDRESSRRFDHHQVILPSPALKLSIQSENHHVTGTHSRNKTKQAIKADFPKLQKVIRKSSRRPHLGNSTSLIRHLFRNLSDFNNIDSERGRDFMSRIKTDCRDRICSELLSAADKPHFKYCIQKTWKVSSRKYLEPPHSTCVFIDSSNRNPVGLASYPGSGNTWVRGLLQRVTGLCIGAIYCDVTLRKNGYPGESIRSGVTFMVKTHQTDPRWEGVEYDPNAPIAFNRAEYVPVYGSGVFITRNPFHAMVAEFKRQFWERQPDNHVKTLGKEYFGESGLNVQV